MYYYIYDSFLAEKKYQKILAQIETRLTDLGISGKINRLSFSKDLNETVRSEIKKGVNTVVVLGNDNTVNKAINIIADTPAVLGIIPLGKDQKISRLLGVPEGLAACETLSSRIIKKINLGKINGHYFVNDLDMEGRNISLECDNNFIINLEKNNLIQIINKNPYSKDSRLEIVITDSAKSWLFFQAKKDISRLAGKTLSINGKKPMPILLNDEKRIIKTPATVTINPQKIKVIVGKNRQEKNN
jgi:diacylglycerol kinase family enzyme